MNKEELRKEQKEKVKEGLLLNSRKLIEEKRRLNQPLIIQKDGKIIKVEPKDFDKYFPEEK